MPGLNTKYTNLSIESKRSDKLRRSFDVAKFTQRTYASWCISTLESSLERIMYLNKTFPHLKILENSSNLFILEDIKANKIVKVEWKNNQPVCNDKESDTYVLFATLHPDFRLS